MTRKTADYWDDLLEGSTLLFGDVPIPVTAADQPIHFVFVRDLPFEVSALFVHVSKSVNSRRWLMVLVVL